jgi:MFS family permease
MAIGYVFDGFGFAGILVGCVLGFTSPFQLLFWSPLLTTIGAGSLSIGSLLLSSAYTYRHGRYRDLGYLPDGTPRTASWVMTGLVWGFSAASIGMSAYAWKMPCCSNDSEKYFLGGAGLSLGALALEILNVILVRQNMWVDALKKAPRTKIAPPVFYPTISPTQPIAKEKSVPVVGMGILF